MIVKTPQYQSISFPFLVNLLLLVHTELTGTHVDQQQETTDDGKDLEEIVLGKILVRVMRVKLRP